ncbi:YchJ family protein [Arcanobacterium ihumii]|uniref:YchJ family protein n=1 Tax=Arcanobacterium ihumii TaxID=2138162 RepID=UPI001F411708|nr:YchJ family metal-binding protein [Arcanobacterium ihumii]
MMSEFKRCPCGGERYATCCEVFHTGERQASTALELMRSRYSAFAVRNSNYLFRTWHPRTREDVQLGSERWVKLEILDVVAGGIEDSTGIVEFIAYYDGIEGSDSMHERSFFSKRAGRWFYEKALDVNPNPAANLQ